LNEDEKKRILNIFEKSEIKTRGSVVNIEELNLNEMEKVSESFQLRNEIYENESIRLAYNSSFNSIKNWGGDPKTMY
jgi:predicted naringenin-chalcone synthase